ncbi:TRAP-type C4-dicarboxylate transport system, substrate-binding protein [Tistlia consotensis]|uniref:TRAP-type C4-dicarboxylate transport system, substrate-binding protein n=1 Tax=Tistlia consotensis USBA 355 TaxID=560819 RepID=A0A1Y6C2P2_9PROT|nr:C4-dicarboxylate TRAP transporter substrate-binding protein [Tistlia consotensis]SMF30389.1 TRAP-type C4-dicarboxylate transport system, substrate-binding protein [Tistlia consotensis USBA 355]SNR90088.1 TRAP-type C4-dicarboxylate transport system, substrate-binding protein [Tistlia consotensis]
MFKLKWLVASGFAAGTLFAAGLSVAATSITASLWVGPKHPVAVGAYDPYVAELKKRDDFDVKYFQGGALLGAKPTLSGLRDGIADVGMMAMTYFPAEFPHAQLVADMGLSTPSSLAAMMAVSEFNLLHCPACLQEYQAQNIVYTGTYSTAPYTIISKVPIRSAADLQGKKMRVPGSLWSRWAADVGGVEVNVPSSEMYEGLDKGALDIAIQAIGALRSYSLWDTAKYVTRVNLGTYHSLSLMSYNHDTWAAMSNEQRRFLLNDAARAGVDATLQYLKTDEEVLAKSKEHGVEVIKAPDDLVKQKADFVEGDVETIVKDSKEKRGIEDPAQEVKTLRELLAKWQGIVEETGGDRDKLIARFRSEVYDKLPDDYGV